MVTMRSPSGQMPPVLQYVLFFTVVYTFAKETPSMTLNSRVYPNGSEVELPERSPFTLHCHGNGSSAGWSSSAFMLRFEDSLGRTLTVGRSAPRHTGTYRCGDSWIHLYIRGPADSASVFVAPKRIPNLVEGRDFLLECLVTDPSVGQLALRRVEGPGGLPPGTAVTFDPRRGALIRNVSLAFRGHYVCSAQREGREFTSVPFLLMVDARLPGPPVVSIGQGSYVRIVGESLAITCFTTNPNHRVIVTWTHTHLQGLSVTEGQENKDTAFHKNLTLTVPSVQGRHGGRFTCTATNQAGNATATADLTVVDGPYLRVYLQPVRQANVSTVQMTAEKLVADAGANATFSSGGANGSAGAEASVVEVWEGWDVTLAFLAEAYPPLRRHQWDTPWLNNTSHQESAVSQPDRLASWLLLRKIRFEDRGNYSFFFSSPVFSGSHTIDLRVYRSPTAIIRLTGNQTLTCSSSGYPLPSLHWYTCPRTADTCGDNATYQLPEADQSGETMVLNEKVHRELVLTSNSDDVTVECVARSQMGVSRDFYVSYLPLPSRQARPVFFTSILIGSTSAALILLLLLLALFYKYKQKPRYEIRWKIIDANQGNQYIFIDPTQLPYNDMKWEFPREQLQLGLVVGAGAFGKVVEATAYGLGEEDSIKKVAVKMLKPSAHSEESEALMSELKILSHLGYHDNIVNLLGACTRGGPMLMITEYCYNGDLLNFLRGRASISDAEEGYKNMEESSRSDSGISCSEYQEMQQVTRPLNPHTLQGEENGRFSLLDLFQFSHQVALGMDFLSSRNCIHRDVAARNVLLTEFRVAKICDFGLARDITDDDNYIIKGNARLPVKWMSPESIFQCVYTTQSDVWSYGVLLWEIFSLGQSPYPNVVVDAYFYKMIKSGRHMSKPEFATTEIYQLMIGCWNLEPTHRPTFTEIGQLIKSLLPTNEAVTHQNGARSDLDRQQSVKSETEDGTQQDVFQEAEPLTKKKMMKNVYH